MNSEPASSLVLPEEEQRQLRVVYAAEDHTSASVGLDQGPSQRDGRHDRLDVRDARRIHDQTGARRVGRTREPGGDDDAIDSREARRGRRRKFVTRHHLESETVDAGGGVAQVRSEIHRALQGLCGMEDGVGSLPSTSHGSGTEVQGRARLPASVGGRRQLGRPGLLEELGGGPSNLTPGTQGTQGPVTLGSGQHALVIDAGMISMINSSAARPQGGRPGSSFDRGRGSQGRANGTTRRQARRRGDVATLGRTKPGSLRRTVHNPLSSKLLAQIDKELDSSTPNKSLDAFVSQLQAPSPDQGMPRVRMRAPTSLAEQANTVGPRLEFDAQNGRGVSTLSMRVVRVEKDHGKIKCLCHCEHSMGVFEGQAALVVTDQTAGLGQLHEGARLILNKPWLVLDGQVEGGIKLPVVFCLGSATWNGDG